MQKQFGFKRQLILLFAGFITALIVIGGIAAVLNLTSFNGTLLTITLQNIVVFILPAVLVAYIASYGKPMSWLNINIKPQLSVCAMVILIAFISVPAMNWIVNANESITLPESMRELEQQLRAIEDAAQNITKQLIIGSSIPQIIALILTMGVLTGIGEETFFRGGLQNCFLKHGTNKHLAIWFSAIVFSFMHFQFYGFVPRMLLGAYFGYLLIATKSLWVPILAHAWNNTLVVLSTYFIENGIMSDEFENIGTAGHSLWLAPISAIATAIAIAFLVKLAKRHAIKPATNLENLKEEENTLVDDK